jgi:hypothetical protein
MYLYKKEMYKNARYKFPGLENIEQNYSQCFQDLFVLAALNGKRDGTFLEIGGFHPSFISNTYLLEKDFGWSGTSIDIDINLAPAFKQVRPKTFFIGEDAVALDYERLLLTTKRVDYLSLDIEPSSQTLACLKNLPLKKTRFSVITYETDVYDPTTPIEKSEQIRQESRDILKSFGYKMIVGNISNLTDDAPFEDWYIDEDFTPEFIKNKFEYSDVPLASHKYMLRDL